MYRRKMTPMKKQKIFIRLMVMSLVTILALSLIAPVARARTYVIRDGERVVTYSTFATDPAEVLDQAGVDLREFDTYTTETVAEGEEIRLQRSPYVTVIYHGTAMEVASENETAGELLERLGITITGEDMVSHGMKEKTYDGMVLQIDRVETHPETYSTILSHKVVFCSDPTVPLGMEEVLTPGRDGELLCRAEVTYINGEETKRQVTEQTVTRNPVTEIIGVGTGAGEQAVDLTSMPVIADGYITLPSGEVLTYTDTATIRATAYTHTDAGCDMITATGTTVHWGTVAVDPRYIPYGTRMFIVSNDGEYVYGIAVAEDCGGDIKGDRMDLYMPTFEQCMQFGRRVCTLYFLG